MSDIMIAPGPMLAYLPFAIIECVVYKRPLYIGEDGIISTFCTNYGKNIAHNTLAFHRDFEFLDNAVVCHIRELAGASSMHDCQKLLDAALYLAERYMRENPHHIRNCHRAAVRYGEKYRAGEIPKP